MWPGFALLAMVPAVPAHLPALESPVAIREAANSDELAGFERIEDEELAGYRGGFVWSGVEIGFGAEIRTYLDGQLVLQTNISWTETGIERSQIVSGALTPAAAAQLEAGILTSGGISMTVGNESVFLANDGQTAILHRTDGVIQNVLLNRASNVTATQEIDATLDLGNFAQFQGALLEARLGQTIGDLVGQTIIQSLDQ